VSSIKIVIYGKYYHVPITLKRMCALLCALKGEYMRKERVDVRVELDLLDELDIIAQRSGLSRSSVIRDAIDHYVDEQKHDWNSRSVKVNIPARLADRLQQRVINGDANTQDEAIGEAIKTWVVEHENFHLHTKYELDAITARNMKNDAAKTQLQINERQLARQ